MRPRGTCAHPPIDSFIAFRGAKGATVWRCSGCGREDVWRRGWSYYGPRECKHCWDFGVEAVACSDKCRDVAAAKLSLEAL